MIVVITKCRPLRHLNQNNFVTHRGARIDKHDKDNFTPLLLAACNGHAESMRGLLSKGADIFAVDKHDKSALFWTAEEDKLEAMMVKYSLCSLLRSSQRTVQYFVSHSLVPYNWISLIRSLSGINGESTIYCLNSI